MSFLIYMKQALSNLFKPPVTTSYHKAQNL